MPPPRRNTRRAPPPPPDPQPKRSQLAKENQVSAQREAEIREAFSLFAVKHSELDEESPEGVISRQDVRRCFVSLEAPIPTRELAEVFETIDPDDSGFVVFEVFFAFAAIHLKQRDGDQEGSGEDEDEEEEEESDEAPAPRSRAKATTTAPSSKRKGKGKARVIDEEEEREQIEEAYRLFTRGTDGPINLAHLRRIAKDLKQDVGDQQLKDMLLEANGGVSRGDGGAWRNGVGIEEFEGVMKRAGVFG